VLQAIEAPIRNQHLPVVPYDIDTNRGGDLSLHIDTKSGESYIDTKAGETYIDTKAGETYIDTKAGDAPHRYKEKSR